MEIISPSYHPAQAARYGGTGFRPLQNTPTFENSHHFALSVQPFRAGGYEATLRLVDLQKASDRAAAPRNYGKREEPGERSQDSINVSRQRAKATVRKRVKDMGGNRLCTLTVRQSDSIGYMSPDDWARSFARYVRLLRKAGLMSDYVAVMEPHKKGLGKLLERGRTDGADARPPAVKAAWDIPLHLHFVTRSDFKMPINLMRKCWEVASGRGVGECNIDVQWLRAKHGASDATDRVAGYVSKYITKGLADFERFNKKRYWTAGDALLQKGVTWMKSRELEGAFQEALKRLGLDEGGFRPDMYRNIFIFPDQSGCWINFRPSPDPSPPPF